MPRPVEISVQVASTPVEVAHSAARLFTSVAQSAVAASGIARIAISGGSTPKAMFELLADPSEPFAGEVPWDKLQLFFVDERCVPPDHPESNFGMTQRAMLAKVPLPQTHIFRMEGELDPEEGAARYESAIRTAFRLEGAETPTFDLILLGMGPDGHTASLFPHTDGLHELGRICMANHVPQKDVWRLTLTWPVIVAGRHVAFLVEGESKAEVIHAVFCGPYDPETYPAQLIRPSNGRLTVLCDAQAASHLDCAGKDSITLKLE
jgi:6-phosphogluconolactonase